MPSAALGIKPALLGQRHEALKEAGLPLPTGLSIASSEMLSFAALNFSHSLKGRPYSGWPRVEYQLQNASVLAPTISFKNISAISHSRNMNIKLLFKNQGVWQHLAASQPDSAGLQLSFY